MLRGTVSNRLRGSSTSGVSLPPTSPQTLSASCPSASSFVLQAGKEEDPIENPWKPPWKTRWKTRPRVLRLKALRAFGHTKTLDPQYLKPIPKTLEAFLPKNPRRGFPPGFLWGSSMGSSSFPAWRTKEDAKGHDADESLRGSRGRLTGDKGENLEVFGTGEVEASNGLAPPSDSPRRRLIDSKS